MSDVSQGPGWWQASDGKWYPPQPAAPVAPPPPPSGPPTTPQWGAQPAPVPQLGGAPVAKKSNRGCLIALAVVGVIVALGIVGVVLAVNALEDEVDERVDDGSLSNNTENPPAEDVTVNECGLASGTRFMRATVDVLNHSSKPSNYFITVAFESEDGGRQLATSTTGVNALGDDQTTTAEANSFEEAPGGQEFSCRITQVERFAA
jgi:hypothetical protein